MLEEDDQDRSKMAYLHERGQFKYWAECFRAGRLVVWGRGPRGLLWLAGDCDGEEQRGSRTPESNRIEQIAVRPAQAPGSLCADRQHPDELAVAGAPELSVYKVWGMACLFPIKAA